MWQMLTRHPYWHDWHERERYKHDRHEHDPDLHMSDTYINMTPTWTWNRYEQDLNIEMTAVSMTNTIMTDTWYKHDTQTWHWQRHDTDRDTKLSQWQLLLFWGHYLPPQLGFLQNLCAFSPLHRFVAHCLFQGRQGHCVTDVGHLRSGTSHQTLSRGAEKNTIKSRG